MDGPEDKQDGAGRGSHSSRGTGRGRARGRGDKVSSTEVSVTGRPAGSTLMALTFSTEGRNTIYSEGEELLWETSRSAPGLASTDVHTSPLFPRSGPGCRPKTRASWGHLAHQVHHRAKASTHRTSASSELLSASHPLPPPGVGTQQPPRPHSWGTVPLGPRHRPGTECWGHHPGLLRATKDKCWGKEPDSPAGNQASGRSEGARLGEGKGARWQMGPAPRIRTASRGQSAAPAATAWGDAGRPE